MESMAESRAASWVGIGAICAVGALIAAAVASLLVRSAMARRGLRRFAGQHVVITGGSEGLGEALATELVALGAKVTVMARSRDKLARVAERLNRPSGDRGTAPQALLHAEGCDVTDRDAVRTAFANARGVHGPVDTLICCAGMSLPGKLVDSATDVIGNSRASMEVNYFGSLNAVHEALPEMVERRSGLVCLVSSAAALTSYCGYGSYSPSKYALRGLADALRNEVAAHNVRVHVAYPANILTPGYDREQLIKPAVTKEIERSDSEYTPEHVAKAMLYDMAAGYFQSFCGAPDVRLLAVVANGLQPRNNAALDVLAFPIAVVVAVFVRGSWDAAVRKHARDPPPAKAD